MTKTPRRFAVGDRVRAGWKMMGCDMQWWEGDGTIVEIRPAEDYQGVRLPADAYVDYDDPVPRPCSVVNDHWHDAPDEATSTIVPLTDDLTSVKNPNVRKLVLLDEVR